MSSDNEQKPKGEAAQAAVTAAVERWVNEVVAPARAVIAATLPRATPEERAAMLARALEFLPGPVIAGATAPAAAPAGRAEAKAKAEVAAPAAASGAMEPLKPDAGNGEAALSRALEALEWRPSKKGSGEWAFVLDREGKVEDAFTRTPLREFLERVRAAPSESGLVLGGYRYRVNERFLHRWPLRH